MERTRRYWAAVGLGGLLAFVAVALARPAPFAGAALLWGWLLARQYAFVREFEAALDGLSFSLSTTRQRVVTDATTTVAALAELDRNPTVDLTATVRLPVGTVDVDADRRTIDLNAEGPVETAFVVEWPIAGTFDIGPAIATATDRYGLFRRRVELDGTASVTVDPRRTRDVHVGQGGEEIAAAYGEHEGGRHGGGLEAAQIREYMPGDDARLIDWKATARLDELHVREQEPTTNRVVSLFVDHRSALGAGPDGRTKLDYLRHVALAFVDTAREFDDTIGLYGVGDEGVTARRSPRASHGTYDGLETILRELTPTADPDERGDASPRPSGATSSVLPSPAEARHAADRLADDRSAFGRTLAPFFDDAGTYVRRIDEDPLFRTVQRRSRRRTEGTWTVIFTDDTRRTELREALKVASRGDNLVLAFLAPSVLYEADSPADPTAAYERYVEFEEFRRSLSRMDGVTAFEVAPGDRLDAVLAGNPRADRARRTDDRTTASETETDDTGQRRTTN